MDFFTMKSPSDRAKFLRSVATGDESARRVHENSSDPGPFKPSDGHADYPVCKIFSGLGDFHPLAWA